VDPGAASLVERSNQLKWQLLEERQPIYGVTTGFGDSVRRRIGPQKAADLQRNMVRYHLNGVGPRSEPEIVRAAMLIRANCLARGSSGLRTEVIDVLLRCLAADILPLIPELGSVGASGDLVPLCYLAETLTGEGEVLFRGELRPTAEALAECDVRRMGLGPRDALALINGTWYRAAFAALALAESVHLARVA